MRQSLAVVLLLTGCSPDLAFRSSAAGITVRDGDHLFAEYRTDGSRGPALWPLCAPGGTTLTRSYPFAEVEGEPHDHPHHESCWFAHGRVNGVDFWQGDGRIVPVGPPQVDAPARRIAQLLEWRRTDDTLVCREERAYRFARSGDVRTVDVATRLWRDKGELVFGDTKEGTMALRLRSEFCLDGPGAAGAIVDSEGRTGHDVWGKAARWVAYVAVVDGRTCTVAMFDHPHNHGHPTHWHARGYGLFAANPFGLSDFTKAPKGTGDLRLLAGQDLRLRYRIWIRAGAMDALVIEAAWQAFAADR